MVVIVEPSKQTDAEKAARLLSQDTSVETVDVNQNRLKVTMKIGLTDPAPLATLLIQNGIFIKHFAEEEINLESAFMALTKGAGSKI